MNTNQEAKTIAINHALEVLGYDDATVAHADCNMSWHEDGDVTAEVLLWTVSNSPTNYESSVWTYQLRNGEVENIDSPDFFFMHRSTNETADADADRELYFAIQDGCLDRHLNLFI